MTKQFEERILSEVFVDTRKFRYRCKQRPNGDIDIVRCPRPALGTSDAYADWEVVKTIIMEVAE